MPMFWNLFIYFFQLSLARFFKYRKWKGWSHAYQQKKVASIIFNCIPKLDELSYDSVGKSTSPSRTLKLTTTNSLGFFFFFFSCYVIDTCAPLYLCMSVSFSFTIITANSRRYSVLTLLSFRARDWCWAVLENGTNPRWCFCILHLKIQHKCTSGKMVQVVWAF